MPGEVSQEIGKAYVHVFGGCLERAIKRFTKTFDVYANPEKLTFAGFTGATYSFDIAGIYGDSEVFVESKGYDTGAGLLDAYKEFLAKAYCTSVTNSRHRRDRFWFVTNVPFGSTSGRALWAPHFLSDALRDSKPAQAVALVGRAPIDDDHIRQLSNQIAVGILTDSFIKVMGITFKFRPGDNIWSVMKLIHGGSMPTETFSPIVHEVQRMNDLPDANHVRSDQRLHLPWYGMQPV